MPPRTEMERERDAYYGRLAEMQGMVRPVIKEELAKVLDERLWPIERALIELRWAVEKAGQKDGE